MPSFQWLKPFSKKNKGHSAKYHDYHGYDNLRHQSGAQFASTPPMMGQQQNHYHNGQHNHTTNSQHFTSQYNQPPPHTLSHRQHQLSPQQLFMQTLPPPSTQLQQHLPQMQQQILQPVITQQHHQISNPMMSAPSMPLLTTNLSHNHLPQQHTHNQVPHMMLQQPNNSHHTIPCHQCSPAQQLAQMVPMQAATSEIQLIQHSPQMHTANQGLLSNNFNSSQLQMIGAHQQHPPVQLQHTSSNVHSPFQQQPHYHSQQQQQLQTDLHCGNGYVSNQISGYSNLQPQAPQSGSHTLVASLQCTCQSCPYPQMQLQSQQQHLQQHHLQQQVVTSQQHISQQQAEQTHYTNVSCVRHQTPSVDLQNSGNIDYMHDQPQPQHSVTPSTNQNCPSHLTQQTSSPVMKLHDYSRYANMQSLINGASRDLYASSKYQEHVYYNQKPELPPYKPPPTYEHFIANRRMYALKAAGGQHMTHLSESKLQRAKDSSYENLKTATMN